MDVIRPCSRTHPDPHGGGEAELASPQLRQIVEEERSDDVVYVAVSKNSEKAASLLQWTFQYFEGRDVCILHVHQPSQLIPTPLGKLPVSQASAEVLSEFRIMEKEKLKKLLDGYLSICTRAKVKASLITTEAAHVHKEVVELMNKLTIRKLVIGAVPDTCMKVKKSSSKATYAAKNAPPFCEIWFVNKGKLAWTQETSEIAVSTEETLRPRSLPLPYCNTTMSLPQDGLIPSSRTLTSAGITGWDHSKTVRMLSPKLPTLSSSFSAFHFQHDQGVSPRTDTRSGYAFAGRKKSTDSDIQVEYENLYNQLREIKAEAETLRKKAREDHLKRKDLESEALEAINKVRYYESAYAREVIVRKEAEDALKATVQEHEKVLNKKEELTKELEKTMRQVALLNSRAQEADRRHDQVNGELKYIQASIATLRLEKQRIQRQKIEAVRWLERWKSRGPAGGGNFNEPIEFVEDLPEAAEFSLVDLQTATCNFSECFKLGEGGSGAVYKGEMLGRTVAIKKLQAYNMQGRSEFQQEVRVLSRLQHPHLVTLLGACSEAWSLVYEYLPNGTLQDRLFCKSNFPPLSWKVRVRIAAEMASALCFLHSSKPEKIVHGDLKPQNILLDSELSCKICDFGICRLVPEESLYLPSFQRILPKGSFPSLDPELYRTGVPTTKSDIYSFGLIILQLITGRPPNGLAGEVRRAISYGKLTSVLDSSAGDWPSFAARRLADLGLQCCEVSVRDRPDLTPALVTELEQLHIAEERPVPSFFLCPIFQEIMHDPQIAADGFTYEGEALRGWLQNGRKTSPMTNLELSHLHLTPNHALRLAIQDWLCRG